LSLSPGSSECSGRFFGYSRRDRDNQVESDAARNQKEVMITALLLVISNIFMTLAWYGHLKFKDQPLWVVIAASWALAFFEYLFQVPANRIGSDRFSLVQLKVMQECITIVVFMFIAWMLFRQMPRWNHIVSFLLIVAAVYFTFNFDK
jgi:uncharacterized protein (DUF486 family)